MADRMVGITFFTTKSHQNSPMSESNFSSASSSLVLIAPPQKCYPHKRATLPLNPRSISHSVGIGPSHDRQKCDLLYESLTLDQWSCWRLFLGKNLYFLMVSDHINPNLVQVQGVIRILVVEFPAVLHIVTDNPSGGGLTSASPSSTI